MSRTKKLRLLASAFTMSALTLLTFQFIPTPQPVSADEPIANLLKDGTMDEASQQDPKMPAHWKHSGPIDGVKYLWSSPLQGTKKESYLQIAKGGTRYFPIASWSQTFEHVSDAPAISISAKVKTSKVTKAILDAIFLDANGEVMEHCWVAYIGPKEDGGKPFTHDWKEYKGVVAIPAGCKKITVSLQDYGPGSVMFDNVLATYESDKTKITDALSMKLPYTEEELTGGDSFNEVQMAYDPVPLSPYPTAQPAPAPAPWQVAPNNGVQTTYRSVSNWNGSSMNTAPPPLPPYGGQPLNSQTSVYPGQFGVPIPAFSSVDADGIQQVPIQVMRQKIVNGSTVNYVEVVHHYMTEDSARFNDEAAAKAHAETLKLTKQYHQEKDADAKAKTRDALVEAVNKEFAAMRETRLKEIDELQKKLEEVKATLAKRDEVKDKIIERRVEHLLGVDPLYQWDSDNSSLTPRSPSSYLGPQGNTFSTQ